jgi:hypothetical protein
MIENAPYKDGTVTIKSKKYPTKRGHLYHSIRFMAGKFRWSEKAVRSFVDGLESLGAVEKIGAHLGAHFGAHLRLCNYEEYQSQGHTKGHTKGHKEEQVTIIPVGGADKSAPSDPSGIIFSQGIRLLMAAGHQERQSRSILGKWRKDHGDAALLAALGRCQREGASDPIAYIQGCFRFQAKKDQPQHGDRKTMPDGTTKVFMDNVTGWVREYG